MSNAMTVKTGQQNKLVIPPEAENTKVPHKYVQGEGYVALEGAELQKTLSAQFPKMLYHPDYGKEQKPNMNAFENDFKFKQAMADWEKRFNRTVKASDARHEKELLGKGWKEKPPYAPVQFKPEESEDV